MTDMNGGEHVFKEGLSVYVWGYKQTNKEGAEGLLSS